MPDIFYGDGATTRTITAVYYQDGVTLRTITEVWYGDGGVNRKVFPSAGGGPPPPPPGGGLAATASPASVYGSTTVGGGTAISDPTTATPTGATGAVSYLWEYVTGDVTFAVSSTTGQTVTFSEVFANLSAIRTGVWRCKVTDSLGFVFTNNVNITLEAVIAGGG